MQESCVEHWIYKITTFLLLIDEVYCILMLTDFPGYMNECVNKCVNECENECVNECV